MSAQVWQQRDVAAAFLTERSLIIPDRPRQIDVLLRILRFAPRRLGMLRHGRGGGRRDCHLFDSLSVRLARRLGRILLAVSEFVELVAEQIEGRAQRSAAVALGNLRAARLDCGKLGIDQIADAAVSTNLAPTPGDLLDDARALVDRRQFLVEFKARESGGNRRRSSRCPTPCWNRCT